jgi:cardiolipin synthase
VLTRQLVCDTASEMIRHPVKCTWTNLCELNQHLASAAQGLANKRLTMHHELGPGPLDPAPLDQEGLETCLHHLTGRDLQPAGVHLYPSGADALAVLNHLIDQAACRIDVLMFYWENDKLGEEIATRLAAKAGPNLPVRVLVDGGGNLVFGKAEYAKGRCYNRVIADLAHKPYVEVIRIRNPFARFDHRKLVLVDGQIAWTGGRNFASSAFFKYHDISFTITGPLVGELQQRFDDYYLEQGGRAGVRGQGSGVRGQESGVRGQRSEAGKQGNDLAVPAAQSLSANIAPALDTNHWPLARDVNAYARLIATEPGNPELARVLYEAIDHAHQHVYMENVYFSDSRLVCKLVSARRRGVDVRAVLTLSTGNCHVNRANRMVANRLLKAGVRVYVYPVMTHAKAAAVDSCWLYLGTGNFDMLSLRHNHELGLSVSGGPLIGEVEARLFQVDFQPAWELTEPLPTSWKDYLSELLANLAL